MLRPAVAAAARRYLTSCLAEHFIDGSQHSFLHFGQHKRQYCYYFNQLHASFTQNWSHESFMGIKGFSSSASAIKPNKEKKLKALKHSSNSLTVDSVEKVGRRFGLVKRKDAVKSKQSKAKSPTSRSKSQLLKAVWSSTNKNQGSGTKCGKVAVNFRQASSFGIGKSRNDHIGQSGSISQMTEMRNKDSANYKVTSSSLEQRPSQVKKGMLWNSKVSISSFGIRKDQTEKFDRDQNVEFEEQATLRSNMSFVRKRMVVDPQDNTFKRRTISCPSATSRKDPALKSKVKPAQNIQHMKTDVKRINSEDQCSNVEKRKFVGVKDEVEKNVRKRMRTDSRDETLKRKVDVERQPIIDEHEQDEPSSNAQFRAIIPDPEVVDYINQNMLGRTRSTEWKKAGYKTKDHAPLDDIPFNEGDRAEIQSSIFRNNKLKFIAAASQPPSLPPPELPEVAFAGRSNVGKSSLINALTRQWGAARTSDKPGYTQTVNFFKLGKRMCVVDLPGYGFAYAKEEKQESWREFVKDFIAMRSSLKRVCILVDAKWGLKLTDEEFLLLLERNHIKHQIVLTKTDLVSPVDLARRVKQVQEMFKKNRGFLQPVMMVSAKTGAGIENFRGSLAKLAARQT